MTMLLTFLALHAATALKVAITGATGRLGRRAVEKLVAQGAAVRCLVRHEPAAVGGGAGSGPEVARWLQDLSPSVELLMGDVVDAGAVAELVRGCDAVLALRRDAAAAARGPLGGRDGGLRTTPRT